MRKGFWAREGVRSGYEGRIKSHIEAVSGIRFEYEGRKYNYVKELCKSCGHVHKKGKYTPDFNFYKRTTGEYLFDVEAKGRFLASDRKKLLAVREANPEIDLRLLFQRDDLIRKGSTTRNSDWAEKHNFKFYFGEYLPQEWLEELIK